MRVGRLILVVSTLVTILVFPLLLRDAVQALRLPSAYAAPSFFDPGGRVYQNGNNDPNNDDDDGDDDNDNDDESDNEGEDNENEDIECFLSLNDNEPVPCDFQENDNGFVAPPPAAPAPSGGPAAPAGSATRCYAAGESGAVFLDAPQYDVTVTVVPGIGFPSSTRLSLRPLGPASVPAPPTGTFLDAAVWQLDANTGCDGASIGMLPSPVNLAIRYDVAADKSRLQIVRLEGSQWVNVDTVPDPSPPNPYISSTIQQAGTYAVIQRP